jgi:hypothetical protein
MRVQMLTHLIYIFSRVSNPIYSFIYAWSDDTLAS